MFIKKFYYAVAVVAVLGMISPTIGQINVASAATTSQVTAQVTELELVAPYTEEEVVALINEARAAVGLRHLAPNEKLSRAAQVKADDLVARKYFGHTTPDGLRFWNAISAVGYNYRLAGENLAVHFNTPETLVEAWLNSPSHRFNIMTADFTETGIGIAYGENQGHMGWFIVQIFGDEF